MTLRNREYHDIRRSSCIKLCRTYKIANILQDHKIKIICTKCSKTLPCHLSIKVAHPAGMELDRLDSCFCNGFRINIGVDISFHHTDLQSVLKQTYRSFHKRRLSRSRRRHEIHKKNLIRFESASQLISIPVVICKNTFFDFNDPNLTHLTLFLSSVFSPFRVFPVRMSCHYHIAHLSA